MSDTETAVRRLFIGNISEALANTPDDLVARIEKFGELKSELDLHHNAVRQKAFGYLSIETDLKNFAKLKASLNGVNFKGSKLVIDLAKDDFSKRWEIDHKRPDSLKKAALLKQQWKHYKKLDNINKTFKDRQELIKGRYRKSPRRDLKRMTVRVTFNGETKTVRCHKTKLWGYEKNKKLRDLVYRFTNDLWKDGNDHIVERLTTIQLKQRDNSLLLEKLNENRDDDKLLETFGDKEEEEEELERNNKVLASLLGTFDFDKELEVKEELDDFGASDYEYEGAYKSDDDNSSDHFENQVDLSTYKYQKEGEFAKQGTVTFDDDYNNEEEKYDEDQMQIDNDDDDEDTEFLPSFGQSASTATEAQTKLVEGTVSNTETLRTLFNTEEQESTFKLIEESDDDIDKTKQPVEVDIKLPDNQVHIGSIISKTKNSKGLFFPHFESPFLTAQTQLNKLNTNIDFEEWESQFWDKRSEWTQALKGRRRDVLRQMRKKNAKNSRVFV